MAIDLTKEYVPITIDATSCEISDDFWAKQGDTGRGFIVTLVASNQVIIPLGELVQLHLLKPDGKQVWINAEIADNKFYVHLTNQSLMASGKMQGEFLISSRGKTKKSETFHIDVQPSLADGAYESTNEFGDLDILIQKIEQYAPSIESWDVAEQDRAYQEGLRRVSETSRISSESTRVSNENTRISQENTRKTQETSRTTVESARVTAENTRKTQETARVTAETTRGTNENTRQTNETTRQTNTSSALTDMQNAIVSTTIVWKASVPTVASIATTYPSPQVGWRVEVQETRQVFRYDGAEWVNIANNSSSDDAELKINKGISGGYAPLDANSKVPIVNLPDEPQAHIHTYNGAVSNVMDANLAVNKVVSTDANGKLYSSGVDNAKLQYISTLTSDAQSQINNKSNTIHTHTIDSVTDLSNRLDALATISHTHTSSNITDLGTLLSQKADTTHSHATSNITGLDTMLAGKEGTITGAATTVVSSDLTPMKVLVSDELGKIVDSTISDIELSYLSGLTEGVQSQIDSRSIDGHTHEYLSTVSGGAVTGAIHADGGITVTGRRISIQSGYPETPIEGDVWIRI